jgi:hypothetical protein
MTFALAAPAVAEEASIGVIAGGADKDVISWVYEVLYELPDHEVVGARAMRRHVKDAAKLGIKCKTPDPDCAAKIGAFGSVSLVLLPELEESRFRLRLLSGGGVTRDRSAELGEKKADRRAGVRAVTRAVIEGASLEGSLYVDVNASGATISVDGRPLGESPLRAPLPGITPGRRSVSVEKSGFQPFTGEARVLAGVITRLDVELEAIQGPKTPPPPPPPEEEPGGNGLFITGATVTGLGVLAGAGLGVGAALAFVPESERDNFSASEFNFRSRTLAPALGYSAIGGGALAVVGGVLLALSLGE